jgi:hypothetical protein
MMVRNGSFSGESAKLSRGGSYRIKGAVRVTGEPRPVKVSENFFGVLVNRFGPGESSAIVVPRKPIRPILEALDSNVILSGSS